MSRGRAKARRPAASPERASPGAALPIGWLAVAIAIVTVLVYWNALAGGFVRDAAGLVLADPRIRELSADNLRLIWGGEYWWSPGAAPLYRPVTTSSFLVDFAVLGHGERPAGYHVLNLLLHLGNAALVGLLLRRLNAAAPAALLASAVFALHPVATEAVANIAGRADLLAAVGVLVGLLLHASGPWRRPWAWRSAFFLAALLGMLSKENAAVLPAMAAAYDALVRRRARLESYGVLLAAGAVAFGARMTALADTVPYGDPVVDNPLLGVPFTAARLTALKVLGQQLGLLVWPAALSADYSYDQIAVFPGGGFVDHATLVGAGLVLGGLAAGAFLLRRRHAGAAFLAAFLLVALLPTANLIVLIGSIRAERFLYLPLAAFAGGVGLLVHGWAVQAPGRTRIAGGVAALVLIGAALRTHLRNAEWRDDETLFRAARDVAPRSYRVHKGLAQALLAGTPSEARLDEALAAAEQAVAILEAGSLPVSERSADTFVVLGVAHKMKADRALQQGREPEALAAYTRARTVLERGAAIDRAAAAAASREIGHARLYDLLGNVCLRMGEVDCALDQFAHLRRLSPERSVSYMLTAWALTQKGRLEEAAVMTLQAWLLDERPDAVGVLAEIYRQLDPTLTILAADGTPRFDAPRVRAHLEEACRAQRERVGDRCRRLVGRKL